MQIRLIREFIEMLKNMLDMLGPMLTAVENEQFTHIRESNEVMSRQREEIDELKRKLLDAGTGLNAQSGEALDQMVRGYLENGEKIRAMWNSELHKLPYMTSNNKIICIKYVRVLTNWGLKEAKDYVEERIPMENTDENNE